MQEPQTDQTEGRRRGAARNAVRTTLLVVVGPFLAVGRSLVRVGRDPDTRNILVASGLLLLSGMVLFRFIEDLGWLDALYFSFITLATIGYGDIAPTTELGKIVTILYSIAGLGILAALISAIGSHSGRRSRDAG
ncbi:MAG: potassium channel family protein [Miltoncostaeaceae bacterium]